MQNLFVTPLFNGTCTPNFHVQMNEQSLISGVIYATVGSALAVTAIALTSSVATASAKAIEHLASSYNARNQAPREGAVQTLSQLADTAIRDTNRSTGLSLAVLACAAGIGNYVIINLAGASLSNAIYHLGPQYTLIPA